jgi:CMP-N,N'-diacetyllegionaminic acid synthase
MGIFMLKICTVCARAGSKGVKNKNVTMIAGRPLIAWSVELAKSSGIFDVVAVSSDSQAILDIAADWGADLCVKRPDELATSEAGKIPAIRHCVLLAEKSLGSRADILVDLDATSPLRLIDDVVGAMSLHQAQGAGSVITGSLSRRSPYFNMVEINEAGSVQLVKPGREVLRRQDVPKCYDMNASIYVWNRERFIAKPRVIYSDTAIYEMPEDRSIDIDTPLDLKIVRMLMEERMAGCDRE